MLTCGANYERYERLWFGIREEGRDGVTVPEVSRHCASLEGAVR
jgi:hypothetical protein